VVEKFGYKKIVSIFDYKIIVMKNIVGNPARGENFFSREREVRKILTSIENDNNIQIAAPRRVGKTSILFYMLDAAIEDYKYVYVDTESLDSEEDFYKKILKEIIRIPGLQSVAAKFLTAAGALARKIKSLKVMEVGIDVQEEKGVVSYYDDLVHFLCGIQLDKGEKLILLIDEFPQTILNILGRYGTDVAIRFLQSNRTLRLNPDIINKVRFIYTGSIGLNHTVAAIDSTAFINDLNTIEIEPLRPTEAGLLLDELLVTRGVVMEAAARDYLLTQLGWLIPFHIQLLVQELLQLDLPDGTIRQQHVDQAFNEIIAARNDNHFAHYHSRLKVQFKGQELKYASEILRILAEMGAIARTQLIDQAYLFDVNEQYRKIVEILVYDGYINNVGDKDTYRFNSPVVRLWWRKYVY
jgi:uncharacterized protein